jgi:pimeloyl-ACP methyl ester carboxylesterase
VILVPHDWGSALGFDWARRHRDRVQAIAAGSPPATCPSCSSTPSRARSSTTASALIRTWPSLTETTVSGAHFIQEDAPDEIGRAIAQFARRLRSA